ncbi:MerR family DNA-binding transcriptional regulator [Moorena producens]|uniref:restriction endonuclease-related protein n=1 Tax=Moorena producens TaxID=1155739 RepID=UPI0009F21798|nr:MerR family DNA-binding transcriptional regulator [Moorena producens]
MSPKEAARRLGVSIDSLRRWEAAGKIQAIRTPSGQRRFDINSYVPGAKPKRKTKPSSKKDRADQEPSLEEGILRQIAKGIVQYAQQMEKSRLYPYPSDLQLGVEKLQALCVKQNKTQPQGIPDFVTNWAQLAIKDWTIKINCPEDWKHVRFIEDQQPSGFCLELDGSYINPLERIQKEQMNEVFHKSAQDPNLYVAFRRFLVTNPVITKGDFDVQRFIKLKPLQQVLGNCYEEAPPSYKKEGKFYCCGHCGGLMHRTKDNQLKCENKHCAKQNKESIPFKFYSNDQVLWLKKGLRYFIHRPGCPEIRLEKQIKKLELEVKLYPERDKYDLHIVFPDQTIWAVDVKFWESAYNLAKNLKEPIPKLYKEPYNQAFFVFPDEIREYGDEYIQEFINHCPVKLNINKSQVMFEGEFMNAVEEKLKLCQQ